MKLEKVKGHRRSLGLTCSVITPFQLDGNVTAFFTEMKSHPGELFYPQAQNQLQQKWTPGRTAGGPGLGSQVRSGCPSELCCQQTLLLQGGFSSRGWSRADRKKEYVTHFLENEKTTIQGGSDLRFSQAPPGACGEERGGVVALNVGDSAEGHFLDNRCLFHLEMEPKFPAALDTTHQTETSFLAEPGLCWAPWQHVRKAPRPGVLCVLPQPPRRV